MYSKFRKEHEAQSKPRASSITAQDALKNELSKRSVKRREARILSQLATFQQCIEEGAIPLVHPSNHQFRDTRLKPAGSKNSSPNNSYSLNQNGTFVESKRAFVLRPPQLEKVIQPNFCMKPANESERIADHISKSPKICLDKLDMNLFESPVYRNVAPDKWMSKKSMLPWGYGRKDIIERKVANYSQDPYIDGFSPEILSRKHDKTKDISKVPFLAVVPNDVWKNRVTQSPSIRAYKGAAQKLNMLPALKKDSITPKAFNDSLKEKEEFYDSHNKNFNKSKAHLLNTIDKEKIYFKSLLARSPKGSLVNTERTGKVSSKLEMSPKFTERTITKISENCTTKREYEEPSVIAEIVKQYLSI